MIILPKLLDFVLLMALGYLIGKLGVIKKDELQVISKLLLKVVLPCLTLSIMVKQKTGFAQLAGFYRIVLWQMAGSLLLAAAGVLTAKLAGLKFPTFNVHSGCTVGGNFAFVAIPIIMALFSEGSGQEYIPICSAVDTLMTWTVGIGLFTAGTQSVEGESKIAGLLKKLANPIMGSILGSLLINSLNIPVPQPVLNMCETIGNVSCLGFVYIGCSISHMEKTGFPRLTKVGWVPLMKLIVVPAALYAASRMFLPQTESIILMVSIGTPTMSTSCMISAQYGLDENYAAAAVMISTILCMATIPLLFLITSFI